MRLVELYKFGIPKEAKERIVRYIENRIYRSPTGCWTWTGPKNTKGYGLARHRDTTFFAHRLSFETLKGDVRPPLVLDHLCRNRACCNPDHLEAVTNRENVLRGDGVAGKGARQTHCVQGHSFELYGARRANGYRWCRECQRIRDQKRNRRTPAAAAL